jgi:phosphoenolpyruvate-protein kinase (PTS system EI component)
VLPVLVGLGYRAFSVEPSWLPHIAAGLVGWTRPRAQALAEQVLAMHDGAEVRQHLLAPA